MEEVVPESLDTKDGDRKQCVQALDDIGIVEIKVEGYNRASELEAILSEEEKA